MPHGPKGGLCHIRPPCPHVLAGTLPWVAMCLAHIVLVPHLSLLGSSLQLLWGFYLPNGEKHKHHRREIKSGSLTLVSWITMWMRCPLTVRIWRVSAVAERSKLYILHPGAPTGKAVMFAAGWGLGGLTLTRRPVLNLLMLLLISALAAVVGWTPLGWCLPSKPQSTSGTGKKLQRNRRECHALKLGC